MTDDKAPILDVVDYDSDTVIMSCRKLTPIDVAKHPWLNIDCMYVSCSRGPGENSVTQILSDGTTTGPASMSSPLGKLAASVAHEHGIALDVHSCKLPTDVTISRFPESQTPTGEAGPEWWLVSMQFPGGEVSRETRLPAGTELADAVECALTFNPLLEMPDDGLVVTDGCVERLRMLDLTPRKSMDDVQGLPYHEMDQER